MASGPCLRRCRVVRRYMPIRLQFYRLDVKSYPSIHVSMYFESFWEGNAVNTGVPCLKVPMHRKLRYTGPHPKRRGARRKYDGKVYFQDLSRFEDLGLREDEPHL